MGITEFLIEHIIRLISFTGYIGVFILMTLESMIAPIPSEAVMPFAGFLIGEGKFNFLALCIVSTLGSITGSTISYYVGLYGGKPFVSKFGKYLLLDNHHLEMTENFFNKYGERTIFISRFIPIVRHLISIPAGVGRMNIAKFLIYTAVGATIWNMFLAYVGFYLKSHWNAVSEYFHVLDIFVLVALVFAITFFIYKNVKKLKNVTDSN